MIGRTYLERGAPVVVLKRWGRTGCGSRLPIIAFNQRNWRRRAPHNVLIRRADGSEVVRSFRGLRIAEAGGGA